MHKFCWNQLKKRWEMSINNEIILLWEGDLGEKEVRFWQGYAEEKNRERIPKLKFG